MPALAEQHDLYRSTFLEQRLARGKDPAWLRELREEAMERFTALGFPTTKLESWKYTNVAALAGTSFRPAENGRTTLRPDFVHSLKLLDLLAPRLVFVNGHFAPEFSTLGALPSGVRFRSLASALADDGAGLERHLARYADYHRHPFVALNTALAQDGAVLEVGDQKVCSVPIHLLYVTVPTPEPTITHPRNLLIVGRDAQVQFVETYLGAGEGTYFTNTVTELVVGENSQVGHCKVQKESRRASHLATLQVYQTRNSRLLSHLVSLGSALARNEINPVLDAEGVECTLNGFYFADGTQHTDNQSLIDHAKPHGASRELYKGVLSGQASAVFNGGIMVRKDAQKTDAIQKNRNLLLSPDAVINTKPQLEIYANDVRCTHGATIGQLDAEALFYLQSRGISRHAARRLLIRAFADEVVETIPVESVRAWLGDELDRRLARPT